MKKNIIIALWVTSLLSTQAFASDYTVIPVAKLLDAAAPISTITNYKDNTLSWTTNEELAQKYDVIIRNNNITWDNEYNSKNYYTSKLTAKDLVIPEEVQKNAKRIYFLVESYRNHYFFRWALKMEADAVTTTEVNKEYNYKTVDFTAGKAEYFFNNSDLVKDFEKDEYNTVNISLVADLNNGEKLYLSNSAYLTVWNKQRVLETLLNEKNKENTNYNSYFDTNTITQYLQKLGEKIWRDQYKTLLNNALTKIVTLNKQNETLKTNMLNSIKKESDFSQNLDKYSEYIETSNLSNSIMSGVSSEIQKIKSYDMIDNLFKQ